MEKKLLSLSKESAVKLALSMYLGESCKYCGKKFETLESLENTVYAGYHSKGRIACKECWDKNN